MNTPWKNFFVTAAATMLLLLAPAGTASAQKKASVPAVRYMVNWIEFGPNWGSKSYGMNDLEQVVGTAALDAAGEAWAAFVYSGGQIVDLNSSISPELAAQYYLMSAWDINEVGQIVGWAVDATLLQNRIVCLTPGGDSEGNLDYVLEDIGPLARTDSISVGCINNNGDVVCLDQLFLRNADGTRTTLNLDALTGKDIWKGQAINDNGQIVGYYDSGAFARGYLFDLGTGSFKDLALLSDPSKFSNATDINSSGRVSGGGAATRSSVNHAFRYDASTRTMKDIHTLGSSSLGRAINNNSTVAGHWVRSDGAHRAFAHTDKYGMLDLDKIVLDDGTWSSAPKVYPETMGMALTGFEGFGAIAGGALYSGGHNRAFVLKPYLP